MSETTRAEHPLSPEERLRWTRIGMLSAFALILGYFETFVPIPIPGVKLGLANIAVLVALSNRDTSGAICVAAIKVLATGLLFGSPVMMAYSAMGTAFAVALMAPLSRLATMRLEMTSVVGALAHEIGQLIVAAIMLGTPLVWYSAPILLTAGCVTGLLCGVIAARVSSLLRESNSIIEPLSASAEAAHFSYALGQQADNTGIDSQLSAKGESWSQLLPNRSSAHVHVPAKPTLIVFLVFTVATLHASSVPALCICLAIAAIACAVGHVNLRALAKGLKPVMAILVITVAAQVWCTQQGTVIATIGPINLTVEALASSAVMVTRLLALTAASIAIMHLIGTNDLVASISWLISPLKRRGVQTDGFTLALTVALQTVPIMADTVARESKGLSTALFTKSFWTNDIPLIITRLCQVNQAGKEPQPE